MTLGVKNDLTKYQESGSKTEDDRRPETTLDAKFTEATANNVKTDDGGVSERPNTARDCAEHLRRYRKAERASLETGFQILERRSVLVQEELEALQTERQVDDYDHGDLR
jgi:hypothetical protein